MSGPRSETFGETVRVVGDADEVFELSGHDGAGGAELTLELE
jgi:hypothetical protein